MDNYRGIEGIDVLMADLTEEELSPLKQRVYQIKQSIIDEQTRHLTLDKFNKQLAGNLQHEYKIFDLIPYAESMLLPMVMKMKETTTVIDRYTVNFADSPVRLKSLWSNFSKKHEFNPPHNHSGLISFVIWVDVPYDIKEETESGPGSQSNSPRAGKFSFLAPDSTMKVNGIKEHSLPVDKQYNGTIAMFPASLYHMVYPFYTSDDYRITISGNYFFDWD